MTHSQSKEERKDKDMTWAKLTDLNAFAYYPFPFDVGETVGTHRNGSLDDESVGKIVDGEYEGEQRGYAVTYTVKRLTDGMYYEARDLDLVKL